MTEDEMVGWHHRLNGHGFEQAPGDGEVQGSLVCCSLWGCKELDTTEELTTTGRHEINPKFIGRTVAKAEAPILWPPDSKN